MSAERMSGSLTVAVGKFDALHLGHRALTAGRPRVGLLSFSGMAEALGWHGREPLVAPTDRARILADWSAAQAAEVSAAELPFAAIRDLDADGFCALVRTRLGAAALAIGSDFRGGRQRQADAAAFRAAGVRQGLDVVVVEPVLVAGSAVSSTRVRAALSAGDVVGAAELLGRPHRLCGTVVRGDGRGRGIGIPTANLGARANLAPGFGVYAAWAEVGGVRRRAAVNIGRLPTVAPDHPPTVEAHLLDYTGDCYGQPLSLDLVARLRPEQRFPSLAALVAQIRSDIAAVAARLPD
jgi:riboflavin kinase/FMN adenylyltransferase